MRTRVVIVGAGFGGLAAARELSGHGMAVTLVDQRNFHTFQPLLYQVATAGLGPGDVAHSIRGIFQGSSDIRVLGARAEGVDWDPGALLVDRGPPVPFDRLVLAAGATTEWFGVDGAARHAFPLYTMSDAVRLRNHILERFERADVEGVDDPGLLTFVVVGGGPTGVEVAGAVVELIDHVLDDDFPHLDLDQAQVVLVEMADDLLGAFSPSSRGHARATLEGRGVEVRTGAKVTEVSADAVGLVDGDVIDAHTVVWASGVRANPLADALDVEQGPGGGIVVGPDLQVLGRPGVFAIGDVASIRSDTADDLLPRLAPVAMQSGRHAARQILRLDRGESTQPFHYRDKGTMATIGRRSAVAELPLGIRLWGTPAWLSWLFLHLVMLVGFRNRLAVLVNWAWNYLTWDRGPRLLLRLEPDANDPADDG